MQILVRLLGLSLVIALCAGCVSHSGEKRPTAYQGGQYYGDALHSENLK